MVPFWFVEAAAVADTSAGLEGAIRPGVVPAAPAVAAGAAVVAVPEAAVVAPPNKPGVAAEVAGAALAGVDPKSDFAAAGALVAAVVAAAVVVPNKPPGLEVAAPPNGLAAAEVAGAGALVAGAVSFPLAPNIIFGVLEAGAGWEPRVAPPKRPEDAPVASGLFPNKPPAVSFAPPPKAEVPTACVFAPAELVFPKSDEPPEAAGWLVAVPPPGFGAWPKRVPGCEPAPPKGLLLVGGWDVFVGGAPAGVVDPSPRSGFAGVA